MGNLAFLAWLPEPWLANHTCMYVFVNLDNIWAGKTICPSSNLGCNELKITTLPLSLGASSVKAREPMHLVTRGAGAHIPHFPASSNVHMLECLKLELHLNGALHYRLVVHSASFQATNSIQRSWALLPAPGQHPI
eukprot:1144760-Pelagomonas_calceolata.AAC.4